MLREDGSLISLCKKKQEMLHLLQEYQYGEDLSFRPELISTWVY